VPLSSVLAIPASQAVEQLRLDENGITSEGAVAMAGALAQGALPRLAALYLDCNRIDDVGVAALAESGKRGLRALWGLSLYGNRGITAASLSVVASALREGAFPLLMHLALPEEHFAFVAENALALNLGAATSPAFRAASELMAACLSRGIVINADSF